MNSWLLLRRLRGPAFLILVGITALLNQWNVLRFNRSWPLYLILAGIFGLVERLVLSGAPPIPPVYPGSWPGTYPPNNYGPGSGYTAPSAPTASSISLADPDRRS